MSHPLDKLDYPPPQWNTANARKLMRENSITEESYRNWYEMNKGKFSEPILIDDSSDDNPPPSQRPAISAPKLASSIPRPTPPSQRPTPSSQRPLASTPQPISSAPRPASSLNRSSPSVQTSVAPTQTPLGSADGPPKPPTKTLGPSSAVSKEQTTVDIVDLTEDYDIPERGNGSPVRRTVPPSPRQSLSNSQSESLGNSSFKLPRTPRVLFDRPKERPSSFRDEDGRKASSQGNPSSPNSSFIVPPNPEVLLPPEVVEQKLPTAKIPSASKLHSRNSPTATKSGPRKSSDGLRNHQKHDKTTVKPSALSSDRATSIATPARGPIGVQGLTGSMTRYEGNDWSTQFLRQLHTSVDDSDDESHNSNEQISENADHESASLGVDDGSLDPPLSTEPSAIEGINRGHAPNTIPTHVTAAHTEEPRRPLAFEEITAAHRKNPVQPLTAEGILKDLERVCPFDLLDKPCPRDETRHAKYPCDAIKICKQGLNCRLDTCPDAHLLKNCDNFVRDGACKELKCRLGHSRGFERKQVAGRVDFHEWGIPYTSSVTQGGEHIGTEGEKKVANSKAECDKAAGLQTQREKTSDDTRRGQTKSFKATFEHSRPTIRQIIDEPSTVLQKAQGDSSLNPQTPDLNESTTFGKIRAVNDGPGSAHAPWNRLTDREMKDLRKTMNKNPDWLPSTTLISRTLHERGRGWTAFRKARQSAEQNGEKVQDVDDLENWTAERILRPGEIGPDDEDESDDHANPGMVLNQAKKLKVAREKAEHAADHTTGENKNIFEIRDTVPAAQMPKESAALVIKAKETPKKEPLPLVQKEIEALLRKHLQDCLDDYEDAVKFNLRKARLAKDGSKPSAVQEPTKKSAFADMPALENTLSSGSGTKTQQFHFLPTSASPRPLDVHIPTTTYESDALIPPKYSDYVHLRDNVLAKNDGNLKYFPYFSDDFDGKKTSLYKDLENNFKNAIHTHRIQMPIREKAEGFAPYFDDFMEEAGTCMDDILFYLLDPEHEVPSILPPAATNAWKNRDVHCRDLFDRSAKKWTLLYSRLYQSRPDDYHRALAGVVCSAFLKICRFSIWWIAKRSSIVRGEDRNAVAEASAFNFDVLGCQICYQNDCTGHGAYLDESPSSDEDESSDIDSSGEEGQNYRLRVTVGAKLGQLRGIPVYNNKQPVTEYRGLQNDGKIAGGFDNLPSTESPYSDRELCSDGCFWKVSNRRGGKDVSYSEWSARDLVTLAEAYRASFRFERGPCEIRKILYKKPCWEIFDQMLKLSTSFASKQPTQTGPGQKRGWNYWQKNTETHNWEERKPFRPCNHEGKCQSADCRCFRENITCEPSCGCADSCDRRYRGCRCERNGQTFKCWQNDKCDCFKLNRECDPLLCGSCGVAEVLDPSNRYNEEISGEHCQNAAIQKDVPKRTLMGHSEVMGWGLYAGENIREHELIGEYKGEVISKNESERRGAVYHYRGLEYLFKLNKTQELDGTRAGNKMRFINHSVRHDNCYSKNLLCNTVQRIGLYAKRDIKSREELFFDYGYPESVTRNFWEKGEKAKDQGQEGGVKRKEKAAKKDSQPLIGGKPRTRKHRQGRGGRGRGGARAGAGRKARTVEEEEAASENTLKSCVNCKEKHCRCIGEPDCNRCKEVGEACIREPAQRKPFRFTLSGPKDPTNDVHPEVQEDSDEEEYEHDEEIEESESDEEVDSVFAEEAAMSSDDKSQEFANGDDDEDQDEYEESEEERARPPRKLPSGDRRRLNPHTDRRFGGEIQRRAAATRKRKLAEIEAKQRVRSSYQSD